MASHVKKEPESYDNNMESEMIMYFLKKCIERQEMSPDVKLKIMFLIYEKSDYFRSFTQDDLKMNNQEHINPLGIDNDLLEAPPENLTSVQIDELKKLILLEVKKCHYFFSSMRLQIKPLLLQGNFRHSVEILDGNLKKQIAGLDVNTNLQNKIDYLEETACNRLDDVTHMLLGRAKKLLHDERKLLEEIDEALSTGERGEALRKVEHILQHKISQNKKTINELKFEISEYIEV